MAVETARVHYEKSETSELVMAFYQNDTKDPILALKQCWPQKEVSVRYDDNIKSCSDPDVLIQMDVTVSGGSDDLYTPETALARTYLYDPNEGKHTLEYMKPFHELNLAGKFGACWKFYGNFLHLHSY